MKSISRVLVLICLINVFLLNGCYSNKKYTKDDFGLVDEKENITIKLGMAKNEVENKVGGGQATEWYGNKRVDYTNGLSIIYRNDNIACISLSCEDGGEASPYSTPRGISIGSIREDVHAAYGDNLAKTIGSYWFDLNTNKIYTDRESDDFPKYEDAEELEKIYVITFGTKIDEESVSQITIGDYNMLMYLR